MNKYYKTTLSLIGLLILFFKQIQNVFEEKIVTPILSKVDSNLIIDLIFVIISFFILRKLYLNFKNKTYISGSQLLVSLSILTFYLYIRFSKEYTFYGFTFYDKIKYFDILFCFFLISVLTLILSIFHKKIVKIENKDNLFIDSPILNVNEDVLDRNYKAKRITEEIFQTQANQAIGFGITGEWGSGKTSFLNLLKKEINKQNLNKNFVCIDFNPWLNLGVESIIQDFFDTVQTTLRPYSEDVYREIKQYSDSVLSISKSNIADSVKSLFGFTFKKNVTSEFIELNKLLKKLNKRIIVFIDDFDRLQSNEIFEILKLIRNTAGFDNFVYVVAYDKSYLNTSLDNLNIPNPENFSEKIFLKEEHLIPVTEVQINSFIKEKLILNVPDKREEIENYFGGNTRTIFYNNNIIPLKHLRDAKRFLNSFINDYKIIKSEVVFSDYLHLKLLKFKFYDIYILLFLNRKEFLNDKGAYYGEGGSKYYLKNKYENDNNNNSNLGLRFKDYNNSILANFMVSQLNYSKEEVSKVSKLMLRLFEAENYKKEHLSIVFPKNYHKYFKDNLNTEDLSEDEFNIALSSNYDDLIIKINEWKDSGKLDLVKYRFYEISIENITTKDQYETLIKTIFYLANIKVNSSFYGKQILGYDFSTLSSLISDRNDVISNKFYEGNKDDLKAFINEQLSKTSSSVFESDLLNHIVNDNFQEEHFILSIDEIKEYLIKYFDDFLVNVEPLTNELWSLFHNCKISHLDPIGNGSYKRRYEYLDAAKVSLISFIEKHLDHFLVIFIAKPPFFGEKDEGKHLGLSEGLTTNIFSSYDDFEQWLRGLNIDELEKPTLFREEFLQFFDSFKANQYNMVEFDFTFPLIIEKLEDENRR
jgi:predicted KAP-like P-loop ATPase